MTRRRSQIVHVAWDEFIAHYESRHRKTHGPLRRDTVAGVDHFYRCGDLAAGTMIRREEVPFFLQLHGLWEGILALPPLPRPPSDIENTQGSEAFWTEFRRRGTKPAG